MNNLLDLLVENSTRLITCCDIVYRRGFLESIDFSQKMIGLIGARGVGKTTAILQHLQTLDLPFEKKLYISADMIEIADMSLFEIARFYEKHGGEVLAIDEIHKAKEFERELKNIYDRLNLQIIFSGSSALRLEHAKADLSRRALIYRVQGLSYREFLEIKLGLSLENYPLETLLENHVQIASSLFREFKPLEHFGEYLRSGYYPFYFEDKRRYLQRLESTINVIIEVDLPAVFSVKYDNIVALRKLVKLLCLSDPYKLNISELSKKIGIPRDRLYRYLDYLSAGSILLPIHPKARGERIFAKPAKLYLHNPNLYHAYCREARTGTIRECFFASSLKLHHTLYDSDKGDFLVDEKYIFEIGGKKKGFGQIKDIPDSYVVADDIEIGYGGKIPLWLFGFLY